MGREVMSQKLKTQLNNSYLSIEKFTSGLLCSLSPLDNIAQCVRVDRAKL